MSFQQWLREHVCAFIPSRSDRELRDVREFQQRFGHLCNWQPTHLTKRKLYERLECMQEELDEFKLAIETQDLAEQADALVDLVYFAKGTASMLGLPWEELWDDVHDANMAKIPGVTKRGHLVDCVKPADWVPPQTKRILGWYGYDRDQFTDATGKIMEEVCCDDL